MFMFDLPRYKKMKMRYISSTHRVNEKHIDYYQIPPKSRFVIANIDRPGVIASLWLTLLSQDRNFLRKVLIRMYWDGESSPSVEVPIGDFFGSSFSTYIHYYSIPIGTTSGGYYTFFPMPFKKALIEIENLCDTDISSLYYMIGYYETSDEEVENLARFHAIWRREVATSLNKPYIILQARGRGHYVGTLLAMSCIDRNNISRCRTFEFLEGNMEILADGILSYGSTGTEDYFLGGWYFITGVFHAPLHGCLIKDELHSRILAYRFHIFDPIPFEESIVVRIHHGEFDEIITDYSSVAYWYQSEPHFEFYRIEKELLV